MFQESLLTADTALPAAHAESELCFGGVQFHFRGEARMLRALARGARFRQASAATASDRARAFARLHCSLTSTGDPPPSGPDCRQRTRQLEYEWRDGMGYATTWGASARLDTTGRVWSAQAELQRSGRAAQGLLSLLAYSLIHRASGAVLHAASVDLAQGVVAFVGPSGAGKSTACSHTRGALFFAADRLAVVPATLSAGRPSWSAYALPGGTPLVDAMPESPALARPLLAVLRIRQAPRGCWFEPCSGSRAVALLLESSFHANPGTESLARLERLAGEIPVGNLHFSLGTPLGALLEQWLRDGTLGG